MKKHLYLPVLLLLLFLQNLLAQSPPVCPAGAIGADDCVNACIFCDLNGYHGTTASYTPSGAPGFCGSIENEQWFGFVAADSQAVFTVTPSNCVIGNGVQIALYPACDQNPLYCNGGAMGAGKVPQSIGALLTIGTTYYLMIDGYAGDFCDFTLSVSPSDALQAQPLDSTIGSIQGPDHICPGFTGLYTVPPVLNAGAYIWTAPQGWLINGQPGPVAVPNPGGNSVSITAGQFPGTSQICVHASNACSPNGPEGCISIQLQPIPPTILSPLKICHEDIPYTLPWGEEIVASGNYSTILTSFMGCDSLVRQQVTVLPEISTDLGVKYICPGTCFQLGDSLYCTAGSYSQTFNSIQGCDSTVHFSIANFDPATIAGIQTPQGQTITCLHPVLTLESINIPNANQIWRNFHGDTVGTGSSIQVSTPGYYTHIVTSSVGGCIAQKKILIKANNAPPPVSATGGVLDASHPTVQLIGNSLFSGMLYHWTGPNSFVSNMRKPIVSVPGTYTLTITDPQTGCTNSVTVVVTQMM